MAIEFHESGWVGPPGPPGPGLSTFTHTQAVPASVWTITHNLGRRPSVTVVDSAGSVVICDPTYTSDDQVVITFAAPFSGHAYLN